MSQFVFDPRTRLVLPRRFRNGQRGFFSLPGGMGASRPGSGGGGASGSGEWSTVNKSAGFTLSSGNKLATNSTSPGGTVVVRGDATQRSTGKYYFEVTPNLVSGTSVDSVYIGIRRAADAVGTDRNTGTRSYVSVGTSTGVSSTTGTTFNGVGADWASMPYGGTVGIAIDFDNKRFYLSYNGIWRGASLSANPGLASGYIMSNFGTGPWVPEVSMNNPSFSCSFRIRTVAADLLYEPPTGFSAWDGGTATNDPWFSGVVLLLHGNGANGGTTFTDSSSAARTITPAGNAQTSTAQSKYNGSSMLFDGAGDWLQVVNSIASGSAFDMSQTPWTIELYARPAALTDQVYVTMRQDGGTNNGANVGNNATGARMAASINGTSIAPGTAVSSGVWQELAWVHSGANLYMFIDGVRIANPTSASTPSLPATAGCRIGARNDGNFAYSGHLAEVRVTKGVGRYTANYTPHAAPWPNS